MFWGKQLFNQETYRRKERFADSGSHPTLSCGPSAESWLRLLIPVILGTSLLCIFLWMVSAPVDAAGITVWKEVSSGTVQAGEPFTYTLHVLNTTGNQINLVISDVIPSGLSVINNGGGTVSNGTIQWYVAAVDHGASTAVGFSVSGTRAGEVVNSTYRASSTPNFGVGPSVSTLITPGDPGNISVYAHPNPTTVGGTAQLVITTTDSYGNLVSDGTPVSIKFDAGSIDGQPAGTTINATTASGLVSKMLTAGTVARTSHITITAGSVQHLAEVRFASGPAHSLVVTAAPASISTTGSEVATITATVTDEYANPVTQLPVTITTSLGQLSGGGTTAVVQTDDNGQSVVTLGGSVAGTASIWVTAGSLPAVNESVYLAPGPPTHLSMQTIPSTIAANGVSTSTVVLLILDEHDNQVDTPLTATISTNLGTLSGGGSTYSASTSNGRITALLTAGTRSGSATVTGSAVGLNTSAAVSFIPGSPDHVSLAISPRAIVADGTSTAAITTTVSDIYGNPVSTPVNVTLSRSGGTILPDSAGATANGVMVRQLRSSTLLGTVSITAAASGIGVPATSTVAFGVGTPTSAVITLSATPPITAGRSVSVTVTVYDSVGHPIPSAPITISTWLAAVLPSPTGSTDAGGRLERALLSTHSGVETIGVRSAKGPLAVTGGSVQFVPDTAATASLAASPSSLFANGVSTAIVTAIIRDQYGNVVPGAAPVFTTTLGTLSGSTVSNSAGVVTRTLRSSTTLGTATVSIPDLTSTQNASVAFVSGPPAAASLAANPTTVFVYNLGSAYKPDETTLVVTVTDSVGHPIMGASLSVTSTFGTILGSGVTDAGGVLTRTLRSTLSGQPQIYVAGIHAVGDVITVQPGPLHHVSVTPGSYASPKTVTAGVAFTFNAVAQDAYNNGLSGYSFAWTVSTQGGDGSISAGGAFVGTKVGSVRIRATTGDKTGVSYAQVGPGASAGASIAANPLTLSANGSSSSMLAFHVADVYGNAVSYGQMITVTSSIGIVEGNSLTDASGVAYRTIRSFQAGRAVIQVTNLITTTGNNVITFTPGAPVVASVVALPSELPANGTAQSTLRITLKDTYGNPVSAGYKPTVSASLGTIVAVPSTAGITDASGTITRTLTAPSVEGLASFTVSYLGAPLAVTGDNVEFVVGAMDRLAASPTGSIMIESGKTVAFSAQAYDADDAPLPGSRVAYGWDLIFTGAGRGTLDAYPKFGPQTTFTAATAGTGVELIAWADESGSYKETWTAITVVPGPPVSGSISISPSTVTANGVSPVTFTLDNLLDEYGNQADGSIVTVTIQSLPQARTGSQIVTAGETEIMLPSTTRAGIYDVSVANSEGSLSLSGAHSVTFVPGPPSSGQVLSLTPAQIVANEVSTSTIVMRISDAYGNVVSSGQSPVISTSIGSILPGYAPTDSVGVLTCTLRSDLRLGTATIAMNGAVASGSKPALIAGPAAVSHISVSTSTLIAGGDTAEVVIEVRDAWGHMVADGQIITPTVNAYPTLPGDWGSLSGERETVDGTIYQVLRSGPSVGTVILDTEGISTTGDLFVNYLPAEATLTHIEARPSTLMVGETAVITLTLTDAYGNVVSPTTVTITPSQGLFDGASQTITRTSTAGTGSIVTTLSSTVAGTHTLTVKRLDGVILSTEASSDNILFMPDEPLIVMLQPSGSITMTAGAVLPITASSQDQNGNAVDLWTPVDYTWWQSAAAGQPGRGALTGIDAHGRSVNFAAILAGANRLWATGGVTVSNVLTVNVVPGAPAAAAAAVAPGLIPADGVSTFAVTLTNVSDAQGNLVQDGAVLTVTVPSVPAVSGVGIVRSGWLTLTLSSSTGAGNYTIVARGAGGVLALSGNKTISFTPGPPTRATISANPKTLPADGASTSSLLVVVRDANSNLVADGTAITVTTSLGTISGASTTLGGSVVRTLKAPVALGTAAFTVKTAGGQLFSTGDTVAFVAGRAAKAQVSAAPAKVPADGSSQSYITIRLEDAHDFAVTGSGAAQLSVIRGSVAPTTTTAANGIITATYTANTTVGLAGLVVAYEGAILEIEGDTLELVPGPPVSATVAAIPTTLPVGSQTGSNLTVRLVDAWNRPIVDGTAVTVTTSLGSIESQAESTVGGMVTRVLMPGSIMGTASFLVETPAGQLIPSGDRVNLTAGSLDYIQMSPVGPLQVTACTAATFTATGRDIYGNPTGTGVFNWVLWQGSGNGVLSSAGVFTGTTQGSVGLQTSQGFIYSSIVNVTIVPGTPVTATVSASPTSIPIGTGTSILTIVARDACGNLVADGTPLNVTTNLGTISGVSTTRNGVLTRTLRAANYYGMSTIFVNGWQAAGDRVSLTSGGVNRAEMTASPASLPADGASVSVLTIALYDAAGMPVANGTNPDVSVSLGTISGAGSAQGGILTRTLRAALTPGVARLYANGILASGSIEFQVGAPATAFVTATPPYLQADGSSASGLAIAVQDRYGHSVSTSAPLAVTTSLGTIGGVVPTVDGVTTRVLTASEQSGVAYVSIAGLATTGDTAVHFVGETLENGNFEQGMQNWSGGGVITMPSAAPVYTTTVVNSWTVDGIVVYPHSGSKMLKLGATSHDNNTNHAISYAWLRQPVYVPETGLTQITFWYRLLSYDVSIGSAALGYQEWDPFETLLDGQEVLQDGYLYSTEWREWYDQPPQTPKDMGWKQGVLDLTEYAGRIVTLDFRLPNGVLPEDNTWVFLDDVALTNSQPDAIQHTYLPIIVASP